MEVPFPIMLAVDSLPDTAQSVSSVTHHFTTVALGTCGAGSKGIAFILVQSQACAAGWQACLTHPVKYLCLLLDVLQAPATGECITGRRI